jgi:hypothetical protein
LIDGVTLKPNKSPAVGASAAPRTWSSRMAGPGNGVERGGGDGDADHGRDALINSLAHISSGLAHQGKPSGPVLAISGNMTIVLLVLANALLALILISLRPALFLRAAKMIAIAILILAVACLIAWIAPRFAHDIAKAADWVLSFLPPRPDSQSFKDLLGGIGLAFAALGPLRLLYPRSELWQLWSDYRNANAFDRFYWPSAIALYYAVVAILAVNGFNA